MLAGVQVEAEFGDHVLATTLTTVARELRLHRAFRLLNGLFSAVACSWQCGCQGLIQRRPHKVSRLRCSATFKLLTPAAPEAAIAR